MAETVKLTADLPEGFKMTELGPLPNDWLIGKLGDFANIRYGRGKPSKSGRIPVVGSGGVYSWTDEPLVSYPTLVIGRKGTAGMVWYIEEACWPSDTTFFLEWKNNSIDVRYLFYRLMYRPLSGEHTKTTLPSLTRHDVENYLVPIPPLVEQRAIANMLHVIEVTKRATETVIAAARELKKSLMRHLFTYGPVPVEEAERVPLKETEVGLVPEHWRIVRVGEIASVRSGISFPPEYQGESKGDYPFFKVSDMNIAGNETYMCIAHNYISEEVRQVLGAKLFPASTIVFPKVGGAIHTNKKRMLQQASLIDNNIMGVTVTNSKMCIPGYLFCWLQTVNLSDLCNPGPLPSITAARIKNVSFPLAPLAEQYEICHLLAAVDRKIEAEETRMQALDALFNTLLHLLMTGRIRVEDIPLPEGGVVVAGASRE